MWRNFDAYSARSTLLGHLSVRRSQAFEPIHSRGTSPVSGPSGSMETGASPFDSSVKTWNLLTIRATTKEVW